MIVKNLLAVGVIATAATVASAQTDTAKANWKVGGKLRMDAVQSTSEMKPATGDKLTTKSSGIMPKRAEFTLTGDLGTDQMVIKYYITDNSTNDVMKTASNAIKHAYVKHKLVDNVSLMAGMFDSLAQSWENDYDGIDQYLISWAGGMAPSATTGFQVNAQFGDHGVAFQVMQGQRKTADAAGAVQTHNEGGGLSAALQYRGNINNMIRPLITYSNIKTSGSKIMNYSAAGVASEDANYSRENAYQTQLGVGVQFETAGLVADLEYDMVKQLKAKYKGAGSEPTTNKDVDTNAIILQAKYAVGMTTPFLKVISQNVKTGQEKNDGDKTGMAWALGVEHKLDGVCRLHAVYSQDNYDLKNGAADTKTKMTTASINLGVSAAM